LTLAGLPTDRFALLRLPARQGRRARARDRGGRRVRRHLVFYESGPRSARRLAALRDGLGDATARWCARSARRFEETVTGTLAELAGRYAEAPPKGEIVIVVGPPGERAGRRERVDAALREAMARCRRRAPPPRSPSGSACQARTGYERAQHSMKRPARPSAAAGGPSGSRPGGFGSRAGASWRCAPRTRSARST
jgi:16S rRNA (cytidine1402-2'-O)-methyltransferase